MLGWDMFKTHLVDSVKEQLKSKKTMQHAVIPGGCMSLLQPLDVCQNKSFEGEMLILWNKWNNAPGHQVVENEMGTYSVRDA